MTGWKQGPGSAKKLKSSGSPVFVIHPSSPFRPRGAPTPNSGRGSPAGDQGGGFRSSPALRLHENPALERGFFRDRERCESDKALEVAILSHDLKCALGNHPAALSADIPIRLPILRSGLDLVPDCVTGKEAVRIGRIAADANPSLLILKFVARSISVS